MSIRPSTKIGIYDILSRIILGSAVAVSLYAYQIIASEGGNNIILSDLPTDSAPLLLIYLIALFVAGEIINLARLKIHPVPAPFRDMISIQSNTHEASLITTKVRIKLNNFILLLPVPENVQKFFTFNERLPVHSQFQHGFWNDFKEMSKTDENLSVEDAWELFSIYIESESTEDINRIKMNLHFVTNLLTSIIFGLYMSAVGTVLSPDSWPLTFLYFLILTFILIFVVPLFYIVETIYVDKLLALYYFSRDISK